MDSQAGRGVSRRGSSSSSRVSVGMAPKKKSKKELEKEDAERAKIEELLKGEAIEADKELARRAIEKKLVVQAAKDDVVAEQLAAEAAERARLEQERIEAAKAEQRLVIEEQMCKEATAADAALVARLEAIRKAQEAADLSVLHKALNDESLAPMCAKLTARWTHVEELFRCCASPGCRSGTSERLPAFPQYGHTHL